jgi:hypothetical protein
MDAVLKRLSQLGLIRPSFGSQSISAGAEPQSLLLRLCNAAALEGSLSVALDVRPDELIGPLAIAINGMAAELRVIDVRDEPRSEMTIRLGALEKIWSVRSQEALVDHLNELFKLDLSTRAVAVLGEWENAMQLWALDKLVLTALLRENFFQPRNRKALFALVHAPTSS